MQGDAMLKSSGISRRKSGSDGMLSPSAKGVMMVRAEYLTEKNFSSAVSGAASAEGVAWEAAVSSEASEAVVVSGFLVKNSIFLFNNAAKMRLCPDSAKSESGPGYKAAGLAKSRGPRGNTGDSAPANAAEYRSRNRSVQAIRKC